MGRRFFERAFQRRALDYFRDAVPTRRNASGENQKVSGADLPTINLSAPRRRVAPARSLNREPARSQRVDGVLQLRGPLPIPFKMSSFQNGAG
jgi:hypothetical protein